MSAIVLSLDSTDATLDRAGGKGANLAELARAGFAVPPGFLVTTDAYRAFVGTNRIAEQIVGLARAASPEDPVALEQASDEIRTLFERGRLPGELAGAVLAAYRDLSSGGALPLAVAVRSSATAEDLPGLSFAGQQDTYLNIVGDDALLDAVRRCWASLWTARAIGYRARNQIAPDQVALAVVVQRLIPSEVSGVLFTANPLTGRRDEIVIDASFGLGEAIVSGQVEPDHYVVDQRVWWISSRKLGAKALAIVPREGGGTDEVTGEDGRQALPDAQILELARTAGRVAAHFGAPQDIEWAWAGGTLHLLQSRPITSLYPLPDAPGVGGEPRVYFSLNSVQGVVDPLTPLGCDIIQLLAGGMLQFLQVERPAAQIVPAAGGRLFVDITDITGLWLSILSKLDPGARQTLARLVDQGQVAAVKPPAARLRALLPTLLPMVGRALAAQLGPEYMRAKASVDIERFLERASRRLAAARTLAERLATLEEHIAQAIPLILPRMAPLFGPAGIGGMLIVDRWLVEWLGMRPGAVFQLLRGLPGNVTSEMDLRLWAEVQAIRADPAAREALLARPIDDLVADYRRGALPPAARGALDRFLKRYGMRGVAEIDIGRPRWRDDPASTIQTIQNYLRQDDPDLAPDVVFRRGAAEAERLAAEWAEQIRHTRFGPARARLFAGVVRRMRLLTGLREAPKFYLIRMLGMYRPALLDSGRDMVAHGALERPEDIFFVPIGQLKRYAAGEPLDLKAIVAAGRAEYEHERARRQMPRLLLSTGEVFYDGMSEPGTDDMVGDPVSPGVAEGRARVVLDSRGVRLEPGEILVCPATDPGWTPLFLTAGGLVMEVGGMVTHGSVVAREYGIPAVVGVHEATTRLRTGQRIRVDGTLGRVTVIEG
ncbi:MAG: phosphoenolpyruvate synthase [Kouleothrix sp.]|nr:phosphoenolpyruvate synthase [Kouleothrix sp.]